MEGGMLKFFKEQKFINMGRREEVIILYTFDFN